MKFKAKKSYGDYKTSTCPFCDRTATHKNEQGLDVCLQHKSESLEEFRCTCGSWLEARSGKFGPYFNCMNCGNVNYNKAMEIKSMTSKIKFNSEVKPNSNYKINNSNDNNNYQSTVQPKKIETKRTKVKKTLAELEREELKRKYYNKGNSNKNKRY